ncbi:Ser/Thr protein phosphatase [Tritrichomonas foetus]|uniref:Serine/threonine-protein phosphatase n=1 Tax=Tritrichomonas foetus TaxID=1144522 RepID=A0A1J4KD65_9EUKA|nr:Ser/Thr protein phosphatase [Tritrichomonas foetus]|eukprot:OHT08914.1 Ser/Thr protein phosphatase [Tritrichomonas foetus]
MGDSKVAYEKVFSMYRDLISVDVGNYLNGETTLTFPVIPQKFVEYLCNDVQQIFHSESVLLELPHNFIIIGDLHGHILDLFRILKIYGFPPSQNYLFLGDIVDRGEFSTETIILIFLLKVLFPTNVYLIRGNHEFPEMMQHCGFSKELMTVFKNSSVEGHFMSAFSFIPLSALIDRKILCVHGGIGPRMQNVSCLKRINRPIFAFDGEPLSSALWSDPLENFSGFKVSQRGSGFLFGRDVLQNFLKNNKLDLLVRAHECVMKGCLQMLNNKCLTVFSASYYCGISPNAAGIFILREDNSREIVTFPPLNYFKRENAQYRVQEISSMFPVITNTNLNSNSEKEKENSNFNKENVNKNHLPQLDMRSAHQVGARVPAQGERRRSCSAISGPGTGRPHQAIGLGFRSRPPSSATARSSSIQHIRPISVNANRGKTDLPGLPSKSTNQQDQSKYKLIPRPTTGMKVRP